MRDNFFLPASITVTAGDTITWENDGNNGHTTTNGTRGVGGAGNLWDQTVSSGSSSQPVTFNDVGTFPYFCRFHFGMDGTVTVQAAPTPTPSPLPTATATPAPSSTLTPTATSKPAATSSPGPTGTPEPTATRTPRPTATPFPALTPVIPAGETTTSARVIVLGDDLQEGNETFVVVWSNATTTSASTSLSVAQATTTVTIVDDNRAAVDIPLVPGFNLIGIPLGFETTTRARDLAESLLPPGVDITEGPVATILRWDGSYQAWLRDFPDQPSSNFELEPGRGYFVRLLATVPGNVWRVSGAPFTGPVPMDLAAGFNLVSVPFATPPGGYDTRALAGAMAPPGVDITDGPVTSTLRWEGGFNAWFADFPDEPDGIFPIEPVRGYFVRASEQVTGFRP